MIVICIPWNPLTPLTDAYGLAGVQKRGLGLWPDPGLWLGGLHAREYCRGLGHWLAGGAESVVWLIVGTLVAGCHIEPDTW